MHYTCTKSLHFVFTKKCIKQNSSVRGLSILTDVVLSLPRMFCLNFDPTSCCNAPKQSYYFSLQVYRFSSSCFRLVSSKYLTAVCLVMYQIFRYSFKKEFIDTTEPTLLFFRKQEKDYCILTMPHLVPEFPLLQSFVVS